MVTLVHSHFVIGVTLVLIRILDRQTNNKISNSNVTVLTGGVYHTGLVVGLDQGVKSERSDQKFLSTQAPGIPPLAPHASLGIDDAQAASLVVVLIGVGGWARPGQSSRM